MNQTISAKRAYYEENGYWIEPNLFSDQETVVLRDHFMSLNGTGGYRGDSIDWNSADPLAKYPRMVHPHRWDPMSLDFLLDARLKNVMVDLLGDEPLAAQTMFYFKAPGARGQALHQDQMYLRAKPGVCLAAWLAVDACDEENGCLLVVPGSHKLPLLCEIPADTSQSFTHSTVPVPEGLVPVPAIMKAGDVLFFHGHLIHGSLPNSTADRFRRSLIAHYVTGDSSAAAQFYHPLLRFDGTEVEVESAPYGGPCGVVVSDDAGSRVELVDRNEAPLGDGP